MTTDYKDTLNLPNTVFPMHVDLREMQREVLRRWEAQDIYRSLLEERRDAEPFILHDGPPYASGRVHVGIGMNKTLKDIVSKYQSMNDRLVKLVPGWDCHGLPIEAEVLSRLGNQADQLSVLEIRRLCEESALQYVATQKRAFQNLGIFADWDRPYLTLNPSFEAGTLSVFLELVERGYVYRELKSLAWCEHCSTTLAEAEVEQAADGQEICWKCDGPVTTRNTRQWFVKIDHRDGANEMSLREKALLEVEVIRWIPAESRNRFRSMLEDRPDWCISRQRCWGVPIPAFVCQSCGEATLDSGVIRDVRDIVSEHGSIAWFEKSAAEIFPAGTVCPKCGSTDLAKGSDILDVWFESGTSWKSLLMVDHRLVFPADLLVEGTDQHRGWFQLSLLTALASSTQRAPMRSVLTHGFVLTEHRTRMSQLRTDQATLQEVLEERCPADVLRLFFASSDVTKDFSLPETFEATETRYKAIRRTLRFLLGNLDGYSPREHAVHLEDLELVDLWALCRLHRLLAKVTEDYEAYSFHHAIGKLHEYCEGDLSATYLNIVKDRLYCEEQRSHLRRSAQTVIHSILMSLVKLLAPILPYTCEEVWSLVPGHSSCSSVHLSRWPRADELLLQAAKSQAVGEVFERFFKLRHTLGPMLEKLRAKKEIGPTGDALIKIYCDHGIDAVVGSAGLAAFREFAMVAEVQTAKSANDLTRVAGLPGVYVGVEVAPFLTCARCRRRDSTCGSNIQHPQLCERCGGVLRSRNQIASRPRGARRVAQPEMRPADLAGLMRARDVRKLAILNNDGRCTALALHPASQAVVPFPEFQPLADYVSQSPDLHGHCAVLLGLGQHTDTLFGIGIHHLNYGTPLGGTREFAYRRVGELIDNLLRLSWGMSVKNASAELPHGGGKSIIDTCGQDLCVHRELRREIYRDFGQFTASLFGRYICAEDMNNTTADTREMLAACRHVMCLPQGVGGSGNPSRFTALAAWAAAKAGWKFLTGSASFRNLTVALQGAGNVGRNIIALIIAADPEVARLYVADRDPEQIHGIRKILLRLGREQILEILSSKEPGDASDSYVERPEERGRGYILFAPCDLLIPAAVGKVINPDNVTALQCRLILPIANNVYSDNDAVAEALYQRGIVDVVENNINWGGALAAASELFGYEEDNVAQACLDAFDKTTQLLMTAKERQCAPWVIVREIAMTRIFSGVHPVVAAARDCKFIGDASSGFAEWITTKWLRNVVDRAPEHFAAYASSLAAFRE